MTNLFTGDHTPYGYYSFNGTGNNYIQSSGTRTSLPIEVESGKLYSIKPLGGISTRFYLIEILNNGGRIEHPDTESSAWSEKKYVANENVKFVQIYYKRTSDTATGLSFFDITIDELISINSFMSSKVFTGLVSTPASKVTIDLDPNADRLIILDRESANRLYYCKITQSNITVKLPIKYGIAPLLTCIILDDNLAYTGAILDGVIAEITDLSQ
ncbi:MULTISPECIES: hypothetical protein [unclassified Pseudoalteromonas]|uniref:hypothetical protein n=1 Tax=unclassified Pseudoalteromonas TaxID=194690 RepID=UPI0004013C2C|nr:MULTISPECIES: hypothetical protein [unclassified Pseudoalteromonas]